MPADTKPLIYTDMEIKMRNLLQEVYFSSESHPCWSHATRHSPAWSGLTHVWPPCSLPMRLSSDWSTALATSADRIISFPSLCACRDEGDCLVATFVGRVRPGQSAERAAKRAGGIARKEEGGGLNWSSKSSRAGGMVGGGQESDGHKRWDILSPWMHCIGMHGPPDRWTGFPRGV